MIRSLWRRLTSTWSQLHSQRPSSGRAKRARPCLEALEDRFVPSTITTIAGNGLSSFTGDHGKAIKAGLSQPSAVTFDAKGNLYIVDDFNERVRKVDTKGIISTIAGTGVVGDDGDAGKATHATFQFGDGGGVAVDKKGNVYIADASKSRVRKITPDGIIHPFAGSFNNQGYGGDGGQATQAALNSPIAVAVDKKGDVFIADNYDIREVLPSGIIKTVAGTGVGGARGDGGLATKAQLNLPSDIAVDAKGNLFILDSGNNRVREVTTNGIIKTIAGSGSHPGFSGDGGLATHARFNFALEGGLALDAKGDVFVTDSGNNRVREITTKGIIKTIAGSGEAGPPGGGFRSGSFSGDNGEATKAKLNNPVGIVVDAQGDVIFSDTFNNRIRKISHVGL